VNGLCGVNSEIHLLRSGGINLSGGAGLRCFALLGGDPAVLHRPGHGRDRCLVEDAGRTGKDLHQEIKVSDAPFDERHPGMVEEVLDVHPPAGGEVIDDDDVVVLCECVCKV